ncbi:MAG: sulfatase-like hydrolase/transferase [Gemmatimonadetes bacterium]|nr:sulfatase-like hydrolase/transferase [Gemmatimonadota bacterium]
MRPNFLIFCVDQMQAYCMGCSGHPDVQTPNLDRLAQDGVLFRRNYCSHPVCQPSRASLITGLTPSQHGLIQNGMSLSEDMPTVTGALSRAGYRTHAAGKLHLQPFSGGDSWENRHRWYSGEVTHLPEGYYGFGETDYVGGHVNYVCGDYRNWLEEEYPDVAQKDHPEDGPSTCVPYAQLSAYQNFGYQTWKIDQIPAELHYNHWITDRTMAFIDGLGAGENFFAWCSFPDPHHPFVACRPYSEMYDPGALTLPETFVVDEDPASDSLLRRVGPAWFNGDEEDLRQVMAQTYGMISHIDDNVGRAIDFLQAKGLYDNTVVAFIADHGEYLGSHHLWHKTPYQWDELLRVPYIWRVPGGRTGVCDDVVSNLDFVPTVLDYAGVDQSAMRFRREDWAVEGFELPGCSLRGFINDGTDMSDRAALVEMGSMRTLITERYKIVVDASGIGHNVLVDLESDPREKVNLWDHSEARDVKAELLTRLMRESIRCARMDNPRITSGA